MATDNKLGPHVAVALVGVVKLLTQLEELNLSGTVGSAVHGATQLTRCHFRTTQRLPLAPPP